MWLLGWLGLIGALETATDCGVGASAPCIDEAGPVLIVLAVACWISPTGLAPTLLWLGRRSWICALLAPPLVFAMYLLAIHLVVPHVGFGDTVHG